MGDGNLWEQRWKDGNDGGRSSAHMNSTRFIGVCVVECCKPFEH